VAGVVDGLPGGQVSDAYANNQFWGAVEGAAAKVAELRTLTSSTGRGTMPESAERLAQKGTITLSDGMRSMSSETHAARPRRARDLPS
jgi:hypothetical protein